MRYKMTSILARCSGIPERMLSATKFMMNSALPARGMAKTAYPMQPYSKKRIRNNRPMRNLKRQWLSYNDPKLVPKFLRYAERIAHQLGVVQDIEAFDEAARAFQNAPPLMAATLLERGNVIMRDLEAWESDFMELKAAREESMAKLYPEALIDQWTAGDKVMETERAEADAKPGDKGKQGNKGKAGGAAAEGTEVQASKRGKPVESDVAPGLADFYEKSEAATVSTNESTGLAIAPRESSADTIGDKRSLERAYSHRLALVVRERGTGQWKLPSGMRLEGEPMRQAAERSLRALFGDPSMKVWYVGGAPVGHWLHVYSPEEQVARKCYGEKVFFYRAEIIKGRFRLPKEGDARSTSFPYDDFNWLSRDEMENVVGAGGGPARALWKYLHQVVGLGAGEEEARARAWKERIATKGLTIAQATGRRTFRVQSQKGKGIRLPAIATRDAAALAAQPWDKEGKKGEAVKLAAAAYYERVAQRKIVSAQIAQQLSTPSRTSIFMGRIAAAKATGQISP